MHSDSECFIKLEERFRAGALVCIGLDSDFEKLPASLIAEHESPEEAVFIFNRDIIDATFEHACAYKPNAAFYEVLGDSGLRALKRTVSYVHEHYPEIPVILDAKRGDLGNTNEAYARAVFDELEVDGLTVHPYMGREAAKPFLDRKDRGIFILAKTSNPGSGEFQDIKVEGEALYKFVARHVAESWNEHGNCGVVVGATYPEELWAVREIVGDMPILVPGIGAQGGDIVKTVQAGKGRESFGLIINSSRGIIFASSGADYASAAAFAAAELGNAIRGALAS
jgi:orotidine-5'-phosphate decarboxylase